MLATRGSPLRLAADVHSVIMAPVGEHSAKPDEAYRRIERLYPGPYLELFARRPRDGWTTWGNEIPALAQLSDAEWLQVKSDEDRRRAEQHIIRDLSKRYRELRKIDPEPAR